MVVTRGTCEAALEAGLDRWAAEIRRGDRRALARAVTLVESTLPEHRERAKRLSARLAGAAGGAVRIGMTGAPGVGKSTFIETFGERLCAAGERVAVLAVDPSSARTGGSILGDKTRMPLLARNPRAFVRPSPSQSTLGGVARRTREAVLLAEAAGYSVVIIETVGVGQSETMVADMTDLFVLLLNPGGGDELQGVKRGVMEMADLILVNKADGDLAATAAATVSDYSGALRLLRRRAYDPPAAVMRVPDAAAVSALTGAGIDAAWERLQALADWRRAEGWRDRRRAEQRLRWLRFEIERGLLTAFDADPRVAAAYPAVEQSVADGSQTPDAAADQALDLFLGPRDR